MVVALALMVLLRALPAAAQQGGGGVGFAVGLGLGVEMFGDQTYQRISLTPDLAFGKFGVGVEVALHYRFENNDLVFLEEDWVPDPFTFQETLSLYLAKIRYVRYGLKGDPLFVKLGSIEDGTLGNGFIMGNYANTLFMPQRRLFGLSLDVDGQLFDFPYVGLETHVGDLSALDVMGARLFVRPLVGTEIPVARDLQVGGTFAADRDPYRYDDILDPAGQELMWLAGVDFRQPVLDSPALSLAIFGDAVTQKAEAYGGMLGFGGRVIRILTYGAQLRLVGDNFVPVYFDSTYDISRAERFALTQGALSSPGFVGWFATLGVSLLNDSIVFRASLEGPFGEVDPDNDQNYLNYPHLTGYFELAEGVLPGFFLDGTYDKLLLRETRDLIRAEGSVIKTRLNYRSGPAIISFFYLLRYAASDWNDPEVSSGLETIVQLN
jgi:hypothetical protein